MRELWAFAVTREVTSVRDCRSSGRGRWDVLDQNAERRHTEAGCEIVARAGGATSDVVEVVGAGRDIVEGVRMLTRDLVEHRVEEARGRKALEALFGVIQRQL